MINHLRYCGVAEFPLSTAILEHGNKIIKQLSRREHEKCNFLDLRQDAAEQPIRILSRQHLKLKDLTICFRFTNTLLTRSQKAISEHPHNQLIPETERYHPRSARRARPNLRHHLHLAARNQREPPQ